mmetsp:Transcript_30113/g.34468  ORF Transcript_30113/g.34468 Transcript_30113/m.34468 type:complete len:89 (-) Transcript_30113:851-1117(-)
MEKQETSSKEDVTTFFCPGSGLKLTFKAGSTPVITLEPPSRYGSSKESDQQQTVGFVGNKDGDVPYEVLIDACQASLELEPEDQKAEG